MHIYKNEEFMKKSKSMCIFKCNSYNKTYHETPHTHEFIEIVYIMSGKMTHVINDQEYKVKHGDILFMNFGCTHEILADDEFSYVNILFSPENINDDVITPHNAFSLLALTAFNNMRNDSNFGKLNFFGAEREEIEHIISAMLKEYADKYTSWETVIGNYLNTLIVKMLRRTETGMANDEMDDTWKELAEYIDANFDTKLTSTDLARKFFYNPSYFSRVFKEKFGVTFMEYITRKRLGYAIDLLKNTDISNDEIAQRSGFSDSKSLYNAFSRYLNSTPSQYRKGKM